jgi:hypothetical protein
MLKLSGSANSTSAWNLAERAAQVSGEALLPATALAVIVAELSTTSELIIANYVPATRQSPSPGNVVPFSARAAAPVVTEIWTPRQPDWLIRRARQRHRR